MSNNESRWVFIKGDSNGYILFANQNFGVVAFVNPQEQDCVLYVGGDKLSVVDGSDFHQVMFPTGLASAIDLYRTRVNAEHILAHVVEALRALPDNASEKTVTQAMSPLKEIGDYDSYYRYYLITCLNFDCLFFDSECWVYCSKAGGEKRWYFLYVRGD